MQPQWFETFFRGVAVEFWNRAVPPAMTWADVNFLEAALAVPSEGRILDVPCGSGRHSIELARRGYRVTGIDLSPDFLAAAAARCTEAQVAIDLQAGDMRALNPAPESFDGAFCFGNSFPYLDRKSAGAFLAALAVAIRKSGRLVIDTGCAAESILPTLLRRRWHRLGDIVMLSEATPVAAESRLDIHYTFIQGEVIETRATSSYIFTAAELRNMLAEAGFEVLALNGGVAGEPFELGSPRLVITARRS